MTLTHAQIVDIVELVCYAPMLPLISYLAWRHGLRGLLGYFYLHAACILRVVYDIVSLATKTNKHGPPSMGTTILGSIGLTPLILALSGFIHEAHLGQLSANGPVSKTTKKWLWFAQAQFHGVVVIGIVLVIIGNVKLYSSGKTTADVNTDNHLREAGAVLLLALNATLVHYCIWIFHKWSSIRYAAVNGQKHLARFNLLAAFFILAKVAYTVGYVFDTANRSINPVDGSLAIKVIFIFLIPYAAVCALTVGGWKSRHGEARPVMRRTASGSSVEYEHVQVQVQHK